MSSSSSQNNVRRHRGILPFPGESEESRMKRRIAFLEEELSNWSNIYRGNDIILHNLHCSYVHELKQLKKQLKNM